MIGTEYLEAAAEENKAGSFNGQSPLIGDAAHRSAAKAADAIAAVDTAAIALPGYAALGPTARRDLLLRTAENLPIQMGAFHAAMRTETGSTLAWAEFNVALAASMLREAAALTTQIGGKVIPSDKPGCWAMSVRQPAGVCLGIAPWNAPVILAVRAVATALACGNTVVLKASEVCPRTHRLVGEIFQDAGFPSGVINVITNTPEDAPEVTKALIDHPAVKRINFTGSTRVGRIIAERAAKQLKPVLLELGGKAPLLVLRDADLNEAVKAASFGAFFNQGQICMSTGRIILEEEIADEFLAKFVAAASAITAGDPTVGEAPLGALISTQSAYHVKELVDDALSKGGRVLCGRATGDIFTGAVVLADVTPQMRVYHEESFGPVVTILRARDADDAVRLANDTEYGLSAAVFGRDLSTVLTIAQRIQSGICHINGPTVHDEPQMPFGGVKASGYGRFGGEAGIAEFTDLRWITINSKPGHFPL